MTTYFDTLRGWLLDLERAESDAEPLRERACHGRPFWTMDYRELEEDGWRAYLSDTIDAVNATDQDYIAKAPVIVQAIEAKMRRDLRYLDAALYAMTGRPAQGFPHLWASHPPYEGDIPEDLAPMAARVLRLCEHAHDLMHAVATTYGLGDHPDAAAERAMDRAQEGGRL